MNPISIAASFLAVFGWASYVPVAKVPSLRRTMWPIWIILVASVALGFAGLVRQESPGALITALAVLLSFGLFEVIFFLMLRIPPAQGRPAAGQPLPPFTVVVDEGRRISPLEIARGGPTLLVFFRGFW